MATPLLAVKTAAVLAIPLPGLVGGAIPIRASRHHASHRILSLGYALAGGIFLGTGSLHLLPEASETLEDVVEYPPAPLLAAIGVCVLSLIDRVLVESFRAGGTSHWEALLLRHLDGGSRPTACRSLRLRSGSSSVLRGAGQRLQPVWPSRRCWAFPQVRHRLLDRDAGLVRVHRGHLEGEMRTCVPRSARRPSAEGRWVGSRPRVGRAAQAVCGAPGRSRSRRLGRNGLEPFPIGVPLVALDALPHRVPVHCAHRPAETPPCPQAPAPASLLQVREVFLQPLRGPLLDGLHQLGRRRYQQLHMVSQHPPRARSAPPASRMPAGSAPEPAPPHLLAARGSRAS